MTDPDPDPTAAPGTGADTSGEKPASWVPVEQQKTDWPGPIGRYLLPQEGRQVIAVRLHPILLIPPAAAFLLGLALAVALNGWAYESHAASSALVHLIWIAYLLGALWAVYKWLTWRNTWFVVTSVRMLYIAGLFSRRVTPLPIARARDVELQQSVWGRQLGYGTIILPSIGTGEALGTVKYVPYTEQIFNEIWALKMGKSTGIDAPEDGW